MNQFRLFPLLSTRPRLRWLCLLLVSLGTPAAIAAAPQEVLGYGVRGCPEYDAAFAGWEAEEPAQMIEYQRYREWCSEMRIPRPEQLASFTRTLVKYGVKAVDIKREGRKIKGYQVPALAEARGQFEAALRTTIPWDAEIELEDEAVEENTSRRAVRAMAS